MSPDIAMWVLGVGTLPVIGFCVHVFIVLRQVGIDTRRLIHMHEHADEYGFGTGKTNVVIEDNTRAMRQLVHYIRWMAEKQTGERPPPFVEE